MKNIILLILLISNYSVGFSQIEKLTTKNDFEKRIETIDDNLKSIILKKGFEIGKNNFELTKYKNKTLVKCEFENSLNQLSTELYYDNQSLFLIRFTESFPNNETTKKTTLFYYLDGKIFDERIYYVSDVDFEGGAIPKNFDKAFGYNNKWSTKFLKRLAKKILKNTTE